MNTWETPMHKGPTMTSELDSLMVLLLKICVTHKTITLECHFYSHLNTDSAFWKQIFIKSALVV